VESDVSCIGQQDGTFLASRYCNVFHRCVSGTRRDFRCPRATNTPYDLWWNQQSQQCDWPCKSDLFFSKTASIHSNSFFFQVEFNARILFTAQPHLLNKFVQKMLYSSVMNVLVIKSISIAMSIQLFSIVKRWSIHPCHKNLNQHVVQCQN
jgi:hypothetical protein